ncbi:hypothetical protein MVEN_01485900 [Mycena venus]|uniref:Uncharacterized protein n=1 Tax=Mycena venus TaxID=2733690 RepID=A0A8H7CRA7_9AGAR|nr:hypothetical protein MVEN_01485900 [Mycena venus]
MVYVGGLFEEAGNVEKVKPWVFANFIPLIRIALRAHDEFGAGQPESPVKEAATYSPSRNGDDELDVLRRIHSYQLASKPAIDHDKSAVSNDDEDEVQKGQDDHIVPNEEVSRTDTSAKCGFKNADPLEEDNKTDLQAGSGHTLSHRDPQGPILSFPRASDSSPESLAISFRETLSL